MNVMGFGGSGHDWSSCVITERMVVHVEEARLTGHKYGLGADLLASRSRAMCLEQAGLASRDMDLAVACDLVPLSLAAPFRRRLRRIDHHAAHAHAAFFASPFAEAAILVVDNAGSPIAGPESCIGSQREVATISHFHGRGGTIELVHRVSGRHLLCAQRTSDYYQLGETENSLGHMYAIASQELGFVHAATPGLTEDGKTMGLAAYGDERYLAELEPFVTLTDDGDVTLRLADGAFRARVRALLAGGPSDDRGPRRAAIACAVQLLLERAMVHVAAGLQRRTGARSLCLAGGVALNCLANSRIARDAGFDEVFVLPDAGDSGTALGSALHGVAALGGDPRALDLYRRLPFLGPAYGGEALVAARSELASGATEIVTADPVAVAAELLARGAVIGWYEGRSEYGPRALGHRSILASPAPASMRDHVNRVIKRREEFRPFAPVVPEEHVGSYFAVPAAAAPSLPFMLMVGSALPEHGAALGAVTHVDGTARLQTVTEGRCPTLHRLLEHYGELSGIPVLLNTSFNLAGDPMVERPMDAVRCFFASDLDALYLEGRLYQKPHNKRKTR